MLRATTLAGAFSALLVAGAQDALAHANASDDRPSAPAVTVK